jgi:hypothetical protein
MTVYVKLMSGDTLSFEIFDGYKFRNLRGEFYNRMSEDLSIRELECIVFFENAEEVDLDVLITNEKTYNVLVNNVCVSLFYDQDRNVIRFEHEYENFPDFTIIKITESVTKNMVNTYRVLYNELVSGYQGDIDFYNNEIDFDPDIYYDNTLPTFEDYVKNKYGDDPEFEDIVKEYIDYSIRKGVKIEEFDYE